MTTSEEDGPDPLLALAHDPEAAVLLRRNLTRLAEQHPGTELGRLVEDVLAGRRPPADLSTDPAFMGVVRTGVDAYREHLRSLSPADRERLVAEGEALADGTGPAAGADAP